MPKTMNDAVALFGLLSLIALLFFFLALNDIAHDYASPDVFKHAGQPLPGWYDQAVNRCPLEWRVLQVSFLTMVAFHVLFFVSLVRRSQG